jgi:hypothetical protein
VTGRDVIDRFWSQSLGYTSQTAEIDGLPRFPSVRARQQRRRRFGDRIGVVLQVCVPSEAVGFVGPNRNSGSWIQCESHRDGF